MRRARTFFAVDPEARHQRLLHARNASLRYLELERIWLPAGNDWTRHADERETVVVPLNGQGSISASDGGLPWNGEIGREDVFTSPPSAAYVPPGRAATVTALTNLSAVVVSAPWPGAAEGPGVVSAGAVAVATRGRGAWQREVRTIFGPESIPRRLMVGETVNPPGHWSGMPPHKHDQATAEESLLEEIYYYRLAPQGGYLVQLFYDRRGWQAGQVIPGEGAVAITRGYHPTVAAPGTTGYFLWALAGPEKSYRVSIDPAFEWMRAEAPV